MSKENDKVSSVPAPITTDEIQPADDSISNVSSTQMLGSVENPNNPVVTEVAAAANEQHPDNVQPHPDVADKHKPPKESSFMSSIWNPKPKKKPKQESTSTNNVGATNSTHEEGTTYNDCIALSNLIKADLDLIDNVERRAGNYNSQISKERDRFNKLKVEKGASEDQSRFHQVNAEGDRTLEGLREIKKRVKILKQLVTSKHKVGTEDSSKYESLQKNDLADGITSLDPKVLMKMPSLYASKKSFMLTSSFQDFETRYNALDEALKLCLLCFSVFPENEIIKKRIMIYWWIGEGFAPPVVGITQQQQHQQQPSDNLIENTQKETLTTPNGDILQQNSNQEQENGITQKENKTPNGTVKQKNETMSGNKGKEIVGDNLIENTQKETVNGDILQQNSTQAGSSREQENGVTQKENKAPNEAMSRNKGKEIVAETVLTRQMSRRVNFLPDKQTIQTTRTFGQLSSRSQSMPTTNQGATAEENPNTTKTAEDYANEFFKELINKGFIEPVHEKHPSIQDKTAGSCKLHPFTRSMVIMLAEKANFFEFDKKAGSPTENYTNSLRACLTGKALKQDDKIERLHTLFNVNEENLEFKPELLGRMKNLNVLYLGRWQSSAKHHIEVEDVKNLNNETVSVLNGLENLNHLKFLSLQGIYRITQLPKSFCMLSKLTILDIRACHNLELLPDDIGWLVNLTHLDISECYLLEQMPKSLSSLKNLQVLKGFVVTEDSDEKKSCKLNDLCKLPLRKLNIYTGLMNFPSEMDLRYLNQFNGLAMLTIAWGRGSLQETTTSQTSPAEEPSSGNETKKKKKKEGNIFAKKGLLTRSITTRSLSSSSKMKHISPELPSQLQKLNLVCFPRTDTPDWLKSYRLASLKKLYIRGGKFSDLGQIQDVVEDDHQKAEWKVEILRLKYLDEIEMEWGEFLELFPNVHYLEKVRCPRLTFFPCNHGGVWVRKTKKKEE